MTGELHGRPLWCSLAGTVLRLLPGLGAVAAGLLPVLAGIVAVSLALDAVQRGLLPVVGSVVAPLRGATTAYRDGAGALRTVIEVVKNPAVAFEHKEYKYLLNLP